MSALSKSDFEYNAIRSSVIKENRQVFFEFLITALFLLAGLFELFRYSRFDSNSQFYFTIISSILMGGSIHVAFSFLILFSVPNYREWLMSHRNDRLFQIKILLFFALAVGTGFVATFPQILNVPIWILIPIKIFRTYIVLYHLNRQSYGLNMIQNIKKNVSKEVSKSETNVFSTIDILLFLATCLMFLSAYNYLDRRIFRFFTYGMIGYSIVAAIYLGNKNGNTLNKNLFFTRLPMLPISLISPIIGLGAGALHGLEYYNFIEKVVSKSQSKIFRFRNLWAILFFGFLIVIFILGKKTGFGRWMNYPSIVWLDFIGTIFIFMHFYLDRLLYRMSNPIARQYVGPLL